MAINFPTSPTTNDIWTENDRSWKFNGTAWTALPTPSVAGNVAYTPAGTGAVDTTVETKLRESVSVKDFGAVGDGVADDTAEIQAAISYAVSSNKKVIIDYETTINLSAGGVNLNTIVNTVVYSGFKLTINLGAGATLQEQVVVDNKDTGWITITSSDAVVVVDETFIVNEVEAKEDIVPVFAGINNAVLPTIGCLFEYSNNTTAKDGFFVSHNSSVRFLPSSYGDVVPTYISGCRNARRGLTVLNNSTAECAPLGLTQSDTGNSVGVDFSGCLNRALNVQHGSRVTLAKSNFSSSEGDNAVYVIWNSFADIYQSDITSHLGSNAAVHARDGSVVCARETDVSNAANRGYHALHAAVLDARSGVAANSGTYAVLASSASAVDCKGLNATGSDIGIHASDSSKVDGTDAIITSCVTYGVYARGAANISCVNASISGNGTTTIGVIAEEGSTIDASNSSASDCSIAYLARGVSSIDLHGSTINNNDIGGQAETASRLNVNATTMTNCVTYGLNILEASLAQAKSAVISGSDTHIYCSRSSTVNCRGATLTGATSYGIYCLEGSTINAQSSDTSGAGTHGISCLRGSVVNAGSSTGTINFATNTVSANGIVFK